MFCINTLVITSIRLKKTNPKIMQKKIKNLKKSRLLNNINDRALNWKSMVLKNVSVGAKNEKYFVFVMSLVWNMTECQINIFFCTWPLLLPEDVFIIMAFMPSNDFHFWIASQEETKALWQIQPYLSSSSRENKK